MIAVLVAASSLVIRAGLKALVEQTGESVVAGSVSSKDVAGRVQWVRGSAYRLPVADGTARLVVMVMVVHLLRQRTRAFREAHTSEAATWEEFIQAMEGRPGFVIAHWCGSAQR